MRREEIAAREDARHDPGRDSDLVEEATRRALARAGHAFEDFEV